MHGSACCDWCFHIRHREWFAMIYAVRSQPLSGTHMNLSVFIRVSCSFDLMRYDLFTSSFPLKCAFSTTSSLGSCLTPDSRLVGLAIFYASHDFFEAEIIFPQAKCAIACMGCLIASFSPHSHMLTHKWAHFQLSIGDDCPISNRISRNLR